MVDEIESLRRRPPQVVSKARKEYDRVLAEKLSLDPDAYSRAVKAALRAYDKILRDYDRKHSETSVTT